jgi:hypothetical protein
MYFQYFSNFLSRAFPGTSSYLDQCSQRSVIGEQIHYNTELATNLFNFYYYNTGFANRKVSACDPKVGRNSPVENTDLD